MSDRADVLSAVFADRLAELRELSRYLHDTVSQELVALAFTLGHIETMQLPDSVRTEMESAQSIVDRCCREMRIVGSMLAPPLLPGIPLHSAIEQLAGFVMQETGIRIICELDPAPALSEDSQVLLATAVQSWLALPIRRRAEPEVLIRMRSGPREVALLELGMFPAPARAADGWVVFYERARALGGTFSVTVESERVRASLRLPQDAEA